MTKFIRTTEGGQALDYLGVITDNDGVVVSDSDATSIQTRATALGIDTVIADTALTVAAPKPPHEVLATVAAIDGKTVAVTTLYTVPAGATAVITRAVIRPTTATAVTGVPTLGIGVAAGEADIFASTALTGLSDTAHVWEFAASGLCRHNAAGDVIKLGIDTAAVGTALALSVDLIGYLI